MKNHPPFPTRCLHTDLQVNYASNSKIQIFSSTVQLQNEHIHMSPITNQTMAIKVLDHETLCDIFLLRITKKGIIKA